MPGDLDFSWELSGSGWATCRIGDSTSGTKHVVSYCTDALADLIRGVAVLYDPASSVQRVSFDLEPIEMRWVLRVQDADVTIAIYEFPDICASYDKPESAGKLVWRSKQPRAFLGHAVTEAAQNLLHLHGEDGYRAKWVQHPFPTTALHDLRNLHVKHDACELPHETATP
ncbi:hypothetical protein [Streptomyces sp. NPDC057689]|uniref:hypothetical protein n=1 Tax=Streptomyces sp. NPDC057689 TaxID=3346213 RepID=UPI0036B3492C